MNNGREVFIASGARTAIGGYGGSLKDVAPGDLGAVPAAEAIRRAELEPGNVQHVVYGNVLHSEARDVYISRVCAKNAGIPIETPALTVNRLCGSGLQAILSAAQIIQCGDAEIAIGGGVESMSRAGYLLPSYRWGQRMGDGQVIDMMNQGLHCPFGSGHMGNTTENIVAKEGITREEQDAFAVESHRRAVAAIEAGYFKEQIVPVDVKKRREIVQFDTDEHPRADVTLEGMAGLQSVFQKDGSVTAGNSSGINDGAGACLLVSGDELNKRGMTPMARIVSSGVAAVDPAYMGIGPIPASRIALDRAGMTIGNIDVIESNEAFAGQSICVSRTLEFDPEKVNPNGGAVALGHPVGASGAIVMVKCLYELKRIGGRYGLVTLCIGGGQGIAMIIENATA